MCQLVARFQITFTCLIYSETPFVASPRKQSYKASGQYQENVAVLPSAD